ncbi:hypothetical protein GCM10022248_05490 [Nonomuraea soli]
MAFTVSGWFLRRRGHLCGEQHGRDGLLVRLARVEELHVFLFDRVIRAGVRHYFRRGDRAARLAAPLQAGGRIDGCTLGRGGNQGDIGYYSTGSLAPARTFYYDSLRRCAGSVPLLG